MYDDDIDVKDIDFLYEMRHAVNLYGLQAVADGLNSNIYRIERLYESPIHGSEEIDEFLKCGKKTFKRLIREYIEMELEKEEKIREAEEKNRELVEALDIQREKFCNLGTNKVKRRLNKLIKQGNRLAKILRLALEIEDKSICAKKAYGEYRDRIYRVKEELILELCKLFSDERLIYGIQDSKIFGVSHVIYFEIPGCEQISWHFNPDNVDNFPQYSGKWDGKLNSTLGKLEVSILNILRENSLLEK